MIRRIAKWTLSLAFITAVVAPLLLGRSNRVATPGDRVEVVFWHFWGGADRAIVEDVVNRFNQAQEEHFVRAVAMPGNNLDMKLFLSVTGGDPPDLVNQDDPILADWAERGALTPLEAYAESKDVAALRKWLFPSALRLGTYDQKIYGVCNGLDVRAMYYNQTLLNEFGLKPPKTIEDLDRISDTIAPVSKQDHQRFGFLPNPKLLWSWGIVFGGEFVDSNRQPSLDNPGVVKALEWMADYGRRYGDSAVSFRARDQSLPGKEFPLLAGRYATVVDGQWRVRDLAAAQASAESRQQKPNDYGVCALPTPDGGRENAGWVNGNFFVVPRGARNSAGAWEFIKFWIGMDGNEHHAARTCAEGGWIPVAQTVVETEEFQSFLNEQALFRTFVELAASPNQIPRPNIPGAQLFDREVRNAASQAIYRHDGTTARQRLEAANSRIRQYLDGLSSSEEHPQ